jgi:predicted amidohydrolase
MAAATMRIGFCQYESIAGDFAHNLSRVEQGLQWADRERVQIVSFPECFLTGYPDTERTARADAFMVDSPSMMRLLDLSSRYEATGIVGFNELRGADLYNTAAVFHKGHLLGCYSKCTAYQRFHRQGREFPVFERDGVTFGVVICSDGGFIEPTRILAVKGAQIVFAPHFNYIAAGGLIDHFQKVRADHVARAVENHVYFVRANNVVLRPKDPAIEGYVGVGYGDSYIVDPSGELVVRSRRGVECEVAADVDVSTNDRSWSVGRSMFSQREFGLLLDAAVKARLSRQDPSP